MQTRKFFIIVAFQLTFIVPPVLAEVYKWTDKQGNVHFGDRPPAEEKAKQLHIKTEAPDLSRNSGSKTRPLHKGSQSTRKQKDEAKETAIKKHTTTRHQCFTVTKGISFHDGVQKSYISRTLSDYDIKNLSRLFKNLYRSWTGTFVKIDCLGTIDNPQEKKEIFKARVSGKWSLTGKLELDTFYQSKEKRSRGLYWWLIDDSKLYFGDRRDIRPALKWAIDVVSISSNKLVFRKNISRTNRHGAAIKHTQVIEVYVTPVSSSITELLYDRSGMLISMNYWNLQ